MNIGDKGKYKIEEIDPKTQEVIGETEYLCQIISTYKGEDNTTHYYASIFGLGECVEVDDNTFSPLN